jgi:membrane protease YdiL (CAAX protease family)
MENDTSPKEILPGHAVAGVTALDPVLVPPRRGRLAGGFLNVAGAVAAWLIILGLCGFVVYRNVAHSKAEDADGPAWLVTVESQGRYVVGVAHIGEELSKSNPAAGKQLSKAELFASAKTLNRGSYSQRLRYAILAGEMVGPAAAREKLKDLEEKRADGLEARPVSVEAAALLDRLYKGYEAGTTDPAKILDAEQRQKLRDGLRWYGDLALAPEGGDAADREIAMAPAVRTAVAYLTLSVGIFLGVAGGMVVMVILAVQLFRGRLRAGVETGCGHGGVYAETFALYLLLFFGLSLLGRLIDVGRFALLAALGVMFLSLAALAWPVLRGVPWRQVREEVGVTFAGRPWLRVFMGAVTYVAAIPLLFLGVVVMYGLMRLLGMDPSQPGTGPSHPIVNVALQKDWWVWVQIFLVASVAAPIVEEIMFRGVLYRHLRELTGGRLATWLSVACSVLLTGFLFAIIHPQGWLGVPVLLALATAFALSREWQGSLVSSMVAHGLNNGVALLVLMAAAG